MSIIGSLPNNLANGTTADASQVMADLNFIVNQVNANALPIGTLTAPTGTRMAFQQAVAPTGWVIDSSITNHTCLYSSTVGATVSNQHGYSSFCFAGWNTENHALTVSEIPQHTHQMATVTGSGIQSGGVAGGNFTGGTVGTDGGTGGNQGHQHPISWQWNYITMCIAQKS